MVRCRCSLAKQQDQMTGILALSIHHVFRRHGSLISFSSIHSRSYGIVYPVVLIASIQIEVRGTLLFTTCAQARGRKDDEALSLDIDCHDYHVHEIAHDSSSAYIQSGRSALYGKVAPGRQTQARQDRHDSHGVARLM